jgi:hypothetical protein
MKGTKGSHGGHGGHGVAQYILQCLWTLLILKRMAFGVKLGTDPLGSMEHGLELTQPEDRDQTQWHGNKFVIY